MLPVFLYLPISCALNKKAEAMKKARIRKAHQQKVMRPRVNTTNAPPPCLTNMSISAAEKRFYSNQARVVFIATLQQTTAFEEITSLYHSCASSLCASNAAPLGMSSIFPLGDLEPQIGCPQMSFVEALKEWKTGKSTDKLLFLNRNGHTTSFPYDGGGNKRALHHPDLTLLASLAEEASVDLRIAVILSSVADILNSNDAQRAIHRQNISHLGSLEAEAAVMADNAYILGMQLTGISHDFFHCVDLEALDAWTTAEGAAAGWSTFADFLHPAFDKKKMPKGRRLREKKHGSAKTRIAAATAAPSEVHTNHLAASLDFIRSVCRG
jgi:hypothetical protein